MNKNYLFKLFLLAIPIASFVLMSTSIGAFGAWTGSPGDSGNTCFNCHNVTPGDFNASLAITTTIPVTGYELDTPYDITVTLSETGATDHGFALTAERDDNNSKVGTLTPGENTKLQNDGGNISQSNDISGNTWTFTWTSPSTDEGGITFYAAGNAANGNEAWDGDQIVTTSLSTSLGIKESRRLEFKMFPNPVIDIINIQLPTENMEAEVGVYDYTGRKVRFKKISPNDHQIDTSDLATGIYIIRVFTAEKVGVETLIKS